MIILNLTIMEVENENREIIDNYGISWFFSGM